MTALDRRWDETLDGHISYVKVLEFVDTPVVLAAASLLQNLYVQHNSAARVDPCREERDCALHRDHHGTEGDVRGRRGQPEVAGPAAVDHADRGGRERTAVDDGGRARRAA